jgi:hypothetical protein
MKLTIVSHNTFSIFKETSQASATEFHISPDLVCRANMTQKEMSLGSRIQLTPTAFPIIRIGGQLLSLLSLMLPSLLRRPGISMGRLHLVIAVIHIGRVSVVRICIPPIGLRRAGTAAGALITLVLRVVTAIKRSAKAGHSDQVVSSVREEKEVLFVGGVRCRRGGERMAV